MNAIAFVETYVCGRHFSHLGILKNHQNSCTTSKQCLSTALAHVKQAIADKKLTKAWGVILTLEISSLSKALALSSKLIHTSVTNNSDEAAPSQPEVVSN